MWPWTRVQNRLDDILLMLGEMQAVLNALVNRETLLMASIADLQAQVQQNTDVINSAKTLLQGLADQLQEAKDSGDPAKIQAVIDQIKQNDDDLAAAVVKNTPAQGGGGRPTPPSPPAPPTPGNQARGRTP
jgi:ATP/maltotriose-dependent transcriptional regulator MalT